MARVGSSPITKQPDSHEILNTFDIMGNEIVFHEWTVEDKTCGCGTTYYTTFTDARLLIRTKKITCCNCCDQENYNDVSIFLRDIAAMRQSTEPRRCCTFCTCCHSPKRMEIRGTFGSQILHVLKADMDSLQIGISAAIGNHKLISHH